MRFLCDIVAPVPVGGPNGCAFFAPHFRLRPLPVIIVRCSRVVPYSLMRPFFPGHALQSFISFPVAYMLEEFLFAGVDGVLRARLAFLIYTTVVLYACPMWS